MNCTICNVVYQLSSIIRDTGEADNNISANNHMFDYYLRKFNREVKSKC